MTALAVALKGEVSRLARKEVKAHTAATARTVAQHRREIAKLKRQLRDQGKALAAIEAHLRKSSTTPVAAAEANGSARFSARSVKAQRRRTGLSAADYAQLVGVSALTIYNWETGKSRPRKEQQAALVALRGISKREAAAKLATLDAKGRKPGKSSRRVRPKPRPR